MPGVLVSPGSFQGFDDAVQTAGKNGKPSVADQFTKFVNALNSIQFSGRTLWSTWGRPLANINDDHITRSLWNHAHVPGQQLRGRIYYVAPNGAHDVLQAIRATILNSAGGGPGAQDYKLNYDLNGTPTRVEPDNLEQVDILGGFTEANPAAAPFEISLGSRTANGPYIHSAMLYEAAQSSFDPTISKGVVLGTRIAPAADQVTVYTGNTTRDILDEFRKTYQHAWNRMRPQWGWSADLPNTNPIPMSTSPTDYRYIFDQRYGDGGAPLAMTGAGSQGITIPTPNASSGLKTQVRVAVYVWAAMSAADGNTGAIGVASRDAPGTGISSIAALTNGATINSTTYQWWPALTASPPATCLLRSTLGYDRMVICGKRVGGAASVLKIGAVMAMVVPSDNIP